MVLIVARTVQQSSRNILTRPKSKNSHYWNRLNSYLKKRRNTNHLRNSVVEKFLNYSTEKNLQVVFEEFMIVKGSYKSSNTI